MAASISRPVAMATLLCLIALMSMLGQTAGKHKYVSMGLDGKWNSTPFMLEISEFLAKESEDYFWAFAQDVVKLDPARLEKETEQGMYQVGLKMAGRHLSLLQQSLLKFALSLRAFSPSIAMYQQVAIERQPPSGCEVFLDVKGALTCDPAKVKDLLSDAGDRPAPLLYKFDHVYPGSKNGKRPVVILYAEMGRTSFTQAHQTLAKMATEGEITYVLRHYVQRQMDRKVRLSGYGVELALKSTEYKAKDDTKVEDKGKKVDGEFTAEEDEVEGFIFSKLRERHPELATQLKNLHNHLINSATELAPLKVWEFQDLGLQAAQRVVTAPAKDVLKALRDTSQNFPSQTRSLVHTTVSEDLRKEIRRNQDLWEGQYHLSGGESALYLNGLPIDMEIYDIFTLLELMTSEAKLLEGLHALGFKGDKLQQLLQIDLKAGDDSKYALDFRHVAVEFLNDLEKDKMYHGWPNSLQDFLRPAFPGMLRHVARNLFHLVFIVDPTEVTSRELLKMAEAFLVHRAPIRLGIVFVTNPDRAVTGMTDAGVAMVRAYNFIKTDEGPAKGLSFITDVYEKIGVEPLTAETVRSEFKAQYPGEEEELVFGNSDDYDDVRKGGVDFVSKSGLWEFPQVLVNGVPMKKQFLTQDTFEEGVVAEILRATPTLQRAIYDGHLYDGMNILDWLMTRDNVLPRLNSRVLSPATLTLDLTENIDGDIAKDPATFEMMSSRDMASIIAANMKYLTRKDDEALRPVTVWVVGDLETPAGRQLLYNAIKHMKSSSDIRVGVVHNPVRVTEGKISKAVQVAMDALPPAITRSLVTKLVKEENVAELQAGTKTYRDLEVNGMDMDSYLMALEKEDGKFLKTHQAFALKVLGFEPGMRGVVSNGKVLGPLREDEEFMQEDVDLLEKYLQQHAARKLSEALSNMGHFGHSGSDMVMKVGSLLTAKGHSESRKKITFHGDQHSVIKLPASEDSPAFIIETIIDPVSRQAQKLAPILMTLRELTNVEIKVFMNPRDKLSDMPLKSFYRYVLDPEIKFEADGKLSQGPEAYFGDMPQKSLLTMNMDAPESWMVESVRSPYDLDNILLEEVDSGVDADFELEYILLEGHCHDAASGQPPRGLQFVLGTNSTPVMVDTIVMANLGYFQLKAYPGVWHLQLREGRSRDIYSIQSHDYTDSPEGSSDVMVAINSFKSKIVRVKVAKKPDKQKEQLLEDSDDNKGLWNSISSSFGGTKKEEEKDTTLNIFSVASGHLYERFLRIMMVSVMKNTKSKVKFWFLKNYLSPTFKAFIPHMAEHFGFEYELVQYKWPRWLNQQTEKQRIIWGYKILFLDVLFPLDVTKIIFVDADQIVRADLQELHDLDLGGAPYGYTPFCDSRKEMDGFRFWKSGYWASHLAGRKYHISALYVVDLRRFRRIAAGDRLRGQYQGLSQDPNSLANLDQDLPNNMIHQVAIKSLPQEWLFCATWCSSEELKHAKTIDLCNNPMTKEPKLKAALRIVPEWKDYDYEIKVLWDKIYDTNTRFQIEYNPPGVEDEQVQDTQGRDEL